MLRIKGHAIIVMAVMFFLVGFTHATTIDILIYNDDPSKNIDQKIYNHITNDLIPVGSLVQVIWAGMDGLMDLTGSDFSPSGDDMIVFDSTNTIVGNIAVGDGYPSGSGDGHFIAWLSSIKIEDYNSNADLSQIQMYIRFFSTPDPLDSYNSNDTVLWGESGLFSFENADLLTGLLEIDVAPNQPLFTSHSAVNDTLIPEPMSIILFILGNIAVLRKIYAN
ncbi:MAG: hypothetical protein AB1454_13865 [Candidatus Auribacterota bacterium]